MIRLDPETLPRNRVIDKLTRLGVYNASSMGTFSDDVLTTFLSIFQKAIEKASVDIQEQQKITKEPLLAQYSSPKLNDLDKKILKALANSHTRLSAKSISEELGIPIGIVQRRRKKLENEFFEERYTLKYEKFGLRKAVLLISTNAGTTKSIGKRILKESQVISTERIMGKNNMSISSEVLFRDNIDLLNIIERIKSLDGVDRVTWVEMVEVLQTKNNAILNVIEE